MPNQNHPKKKQESSISTISQPWEWDGRAAHQEIFHTVESYTHWLVPLITVPKTNRPSQKESHLTPGPTGPSAAMLVFRGGRSQQF